MVTFNPAGREWDIAVGGVPFMLATTQDLPQSVETIPVRKEQFDTEADPGEQSLSDWWRRSQSSFHEGAGLLYQEGVDGQTPSNGFYDSEGVSVFEPGKVTMLDTMRTDSFFAAGSTTRVLSCQAMVYQGALRELTTSSFPPATWYAPSGETVIDGWMGSAYIWAITEEGNLHQLQRGGGPLIVWPLGGTLSSDARLAWGKDRIWIIDENKIWQPDQTLATGVTQNPVYTSPNGNLTYTALAETPGPMLFAAHDGTSSVVQAITIGSDGSLPTLSGATVLAALPGGELVTELAVVGGQYVAMGSNLGLRIGKLSGGTLTYGPIVTAATDCRALVADGRYFVAAFTSTVGTLLRFDTATEVAEGVFAYAKDLAVTDGTQVTSLATTQGPSGSDNTVIWAVANGRPWQQLTTTRVTTGYLQTGRIRFRTMEKKAFKYLNIETPPLQGTIAVSAILPDGSTVALGTYSTQDQVPENALSLANIAPCRYISLRFTFTRSGSQNPEFNSYQLRALPSVVPQRLYTLPLLCYDRETAKSGQRYGSDGYAFQRLEALQAMEDTQETVTYQDFSRDPSNPGVDTLIESIRFVQTSPSTPPQGDHTGGILILQLRTLEA